MRVLLAIGCNSYDLINPLNGAELDAEHVFNLLTGSAGEYDLAASQLLQSPTIGAVRSALDQLYGHSPIDVLTVFFAGHGEVKNGTFFALVRDSDPSRYAVTALSCDRLLEAVGEVALNGATPTQVNIILDACQSGGAMFDMGSILKREMLGQASSFSVSFLAACADYQYAGETPAGGIATTALIECLTGVREIQRTRPYLDLVELGRPLSSEVAAAHTEQIPVTWGLNLFGESRFAKNPYYSAQYHTPSLPVSHVPPAGAVGAVLESHADDLWREYSNLSREADCPRLVQLFTRVGDAMAASGAPVLPFLRGVATSFSTRARISRDLAAEACVLAAAAVATLRYPAEAGIGTLADSLLGEWLGATQTARAELLQSISQRPNAFLGFVGGFAELHYLPLRLAGVLGWFGSELLVRRLLGQPQSEQDDVLLSLETIVQNILQAYGGACAAVSDSQAASLYSFAKAVAADRPELAISILDKILHSFVQNEGAVIKLDASPDEVFEFTLCRSHGLSGKEIPAELVARPSCLLAAVLTAGMTLGCEAWDLKFQKIDHQYLSIFVPNSFGDFASIRIEHGMNHTVRIGHGIWTLGDYRAFFDTQVRPTLLSAASLGARERALAVLGSIVLPDRLPLFLELDSSVEESTAAPASGAGGASAP